MPTRFARLRGFAPLEGLRVAIACAILVDAVRSFHAPESSLLGLLVRWHGATLLPSILGLGLGAALLARGRLAAATLGVAALLAAWNAAEFYGLVARGLHTGPVPLSVPVALLLGLYAVRALSPAPRASRVWAIAGAVVGMPALLLVHLVTFGATDYGRPADAIVVFGAKVYDDGTPSLALDDRIRHALRLYHAGVAPRLVLSGGPEEVACMARIAREDGVPEPAIERDPDGLNTWATMSNLRYRRVVAVSHYYHLARIKLAAARLGIVCYTVPCTMTRRLTHEPAHVARELAAFTAYYLLR